MIETIWNIYKELSAWSILITAILILLFGGGVHVTIGNKDK
jgi:hypothetical protein